MRVLKLLTRGSLLGASAYGLYDLTTDEQLVVRGCRTLKCGWDILYNYKFKFSPETIDEVHDTVARSLYNMCNNNDGLYVKFGQQIASSEHTVPPVYYKYFSKLQDQAKVAPFEKVDKVLKEELGEKYQTEVFKEFNQTPIAAASIAQVHKAILKDGREVAVKIQKPNIKRQFKSDMFFHWLFCYVMDYAFELPISEFQQSIEENLELEIDFRIEAANTERTRHDVQNKLKNRHIYVPQIYHEYNSKRVLVMEWINGTKITDDEKLKQQGFDMKKLVQNSIEFFSEQIFISGFVHCDPHPGNLLARKIKDSKGKEIEQVVVLDYGLCFPLREDFRIKYCQFWESLFLGNQEKMKEIIKDWGIQNSDLFASAQLLRPYSKSKHINDKISKDDVYKMQQDFKNEFKNMLSDANKFPDELLFIGRNMNLVRSLNKSMGSSVNRINVMANYAVKGQQYVNINKDTGKVMEYSRFETDKDKLSKQIMVYNKNNDIFQNRFSLVWFQCRLFFSTVLYKLYQFYLKTFKNSSVEQEIENKMAEFANEKFEAFGVKIDEQTFSG